MGKRAKEHRKKVAKRNQAVQQSQKQFQKLYQEMMMKQLEKLREEQSGTTQENQSTEINSPE